MQRRRFVLFVIGIAIGLIVSGCLPIVSADFTLKIGRNEAWTLDFKIATSPDYQQFLASTLEERLASVRQQGGKVTITTQDSLPDGSAPVSVSIKGTGYDLLNQVLNGAVVVDNSSGKRVLIFNSDLSTQFATNNFTFTLTGGEILSTNGGLVSHNSARWENPVGSMRASMREPTYFDSLLFVALVIIGLIFLVSGVLFINDQWKPASARRAKSRRSTTPSVPAKQDFPAGPGYPLRGGAEPFNPTLPVQSEKFCNQCGGLIPAHADFCPLCGAKQT